MKLEDIPNVELEWAARAERVRRSQARTDITGMTRPQRDADERAFLREAGQLGPFVETSVVIPQRVSEKVPE